jgi:hypothetical protein
MKTEKMIMARFGLKYGEACKIVKEARVNLGLPSSCAWTEELEKESCRLCEGDKEDDNNTTTTKSKLVAHDSISTVTTSGSTTTSPPPATSCVTISTSQPQAVASPKNKNTSQTQIYTIVSENTASQAPKSSQKAAKTFTSNKLVTDLQNDTLLEGATIKQKAPKLPIRQSSDTRLEDTGCLEYDSAVEECDDGDDSASYSDDECANIPLPVIRPLRRTDSRTKHA